MNAPRSYSVRLPDGQYLGRDSITSPLAPCHVAQAYCYDSAADAAAVADYYGQGATVVPSPWWDANAKRYVEGA